MGSTFKNSCLVGLGAIAGVAVTMQFSALAQKPVDAGMPLAELRQLADVYGVIKSTYVEPVEDKALLSQAISGMVASLDPHSAYLDPRAYRELREGTEGRFVGLGIEISESEDGFVEIVAPIEDSPAWHAGIKEGDLITQIDGQPVQGLPIDEAIKRMRGEPGTRVTLTIARKDSPAPLRFTIARGEIVGADALDSATRLLPSAPAGLISDPASAVGRAAVRDIAAGTLLSSNLIKSPQTIKRGQSVTLSLASGAVAVRVAGTALRDGALGERIPVRNLNSKRVVEGVILEAGVVEVAAGRPAAMQR